MVDERQDVCRRELGAPEPKGDVVASEVGYLLHHRVLLERNRYAVLEARADQAPYVLYEVGRLREIACRGWRDGSARGTDLDRFDLYYSHLVLWDKDRRQVAGAARLGRSDFITARFGTRGLSASTFFDIKEGFLEHLHWPLEVGGLFVGEEYRNCPEALTLILRGLGSVLLSRNPCRFFIGVMPVHPVAASAVMTGHPSAGTETFEGARAFVRPRWTVKRKSLSLPLRYARLGLRAISVGLDTSRGKRQVALVLADTALWKRSLLRRVAGMEGMNCLALAWRDSLTGFRAA